MSSSRRWPVAAASLVWVASLVGCSGQVDGASAATAHDLEAAHAVEQGLGHAVAFFVRPTSDDARVVWSIPAAAGQVVGDDSFGGIDTSPFRVVGPEATSDFRANLKTSCGGSMSGHASIKSAPPKLYVQWSLDAGATHARSDGELTIDASSIRGSITTSLALGDAQCHTQPEKRLTVTVDVKYRPAEAGKAFCVESGTVIVSGAAALATARRITWETCGAAPAVR